LTDAVVSEEPTVTIVAAEVISPIVVLMVEAARTSETSVNIYQTTRGIIPEDSHFILTTCEPEISNKT
jgi:regulator of extracellular matrix RemA (YlzA/DUF370 family)